MKLKEKVKENRAERKEKRADRREERKAKWSEPAPDYSQNPKAKQTSPNDYTKAEKKYVTETSTSLAKAIKDGKTGYIEQPVQRETREQLAERIAPAPVAAPAGTLEEKQNAVAAARKERRQEIKHTMTRTVEEARKEGYTSLRQANDRLQAAKGDKTRYLNQDFEADRQKTRASIEDGSYTTTARKKLDAAEVLQSKTAAQGIQKLAQAASQRAEDRRMPENGRIVAGVVNGEDMNGSGAFFENEYPYMAYMTAQERETVRRLAARGDYETIGVYYDAIHRDLTARKQADDSAVTVASAKETPVAAVAGNLLGAAGSVMATGATVKQGVQNWATGDYAPVDPNAGGMQLAHLQADTQAGIGDAAYEFGYKHGGETGGNVARFVADTGLSVLQNLAYLPLGPVGALVGMGASAAGSQALESAEKGQTVKQTLALAGIVGAMEIITEKLPMDNLFVALKAAGKGGSAKSILKQLLLGHLKQAGLEGAEEVITEYADTIADLMISGDESDYYQTAAELVRRGYSEADARKAAMVQYFAANPAMAGLGGALAGGMMMGGVQLRNAAVYGANRAAYKAIDRLTRNVDIDEDMDEELPPEEQTVVGADEAHLTPEERAKIEDYKNAVNPELYQFTQDMIDGTEQKFKRLTVSQVGTKQADMLRELTGRDFSGYQNAINSNGLRHILNRHGANGQHDQTMQDPADIARAAWVMEHADSCDYVRDKKGNIVYSSEITDSENKPAPLVIFAKKIDGTYYSVEAAAENRHKKLWITTAYMSKGGGVTEVSNASEDALDGTSETTLPSPPPKNSIRQADRDVKRQDSPETDTAEVNPLQQQINAMAGVQPEVQPKIDNQPENMKGANENEVSVSGGAQRAAVQSAGGQGGTVSEELRGDAAAHGDRGAAQRAGAAAGREAETAHIRQVIERLSRYAKLPKTSSEELGLENGTKRRATRVIPEEMWDDGMQETAQTIRAYGLEPVFFSGDLEIAYDNGKTGTAKGAYTGDRIMVRVDHGKYSPQQIAEHEIFHYLAQMAPGMRAEMLETLKQHYTKEEIDRIVDVYAQAYLDLYDTEDKILEEFLADAYAGIDFRGILASEYTQTARNQVEEYKSRPGNAARMRGPPEGGSERYAINEDFGEDIWAWYEADMPDGERFVLGSTGPVLQGLGAIESDIYMDGDKIKTILNDHPEMTIREIQRIPELLEDPVLVLKSNGSNRRGQNTRLVIFGNIKAQNGKPMLAILDLRPVERGFVLDDMQKVNSSYTRDNALNYIQNSEILHADKKRTIPLLRTMGLQARPIELQQDDSIGSISYRGQNVNLTGAPFSSVVKLGTEVKPRNTKFSLDDPERPTPAELVNQQMAERARENGVDVPETELERRRRERLEALREQPEDGTMGAKKISLKEGLVNGRREETRAAFLRRAPREGYGVFKGDTFACGFRRAGSNSGVAFDQGNLRRPGSNSQEAQRELKTIGIAADVIDGPLLVNINGVTTELDVPEATTIAKSHVFINKDTTLPPRRIAGHEAFHLWENGVGRDAYIGILEDNLLFTSAEFLEYQSAIAQAYLGEEADLANDDQMKRLREELFAYISGHINDGSLDDFLWPMFRDFEAVQAAWDTMVEQNAAEIKTDDPDENPLQRQIDEMAGVRRPKKADSGKVKFSMDDPEENSLQQQINAMAGIVPETKPPQEAEEAERPNAVAETDNPLQQQINAMAGIVPEQEQPKKLSRSTRAHKEQEAQKLKYRQLKRRVKKTKSKIEAMKAIKRRGLELSPMQEQLLEDWQEDLDVYRAEQQRKLPEWQAELEKWNRKMDIEAQAPELAKEKLKKKIIDLFHIPPENWDEIREIVESVTNEAIEHGKLTEETRERLMERLAQAGVWTVAADEYLEAIRSEVTNSSIYVPQTVIDQLGEEWGPQRQRAYRNRIYLTQDPNHNSIGSLAEYLGHIYPGLFDLATTEADALDLILFAAETEREQGLTLEELLADTNRKEGREAAEAVMADLQQQLDEAIRTFAAAAGIESEVREKNRLQQARENRRRNELVQAEIDRKKEQQLKRDLLDSLQWLQKNRNKAPEELREEFDKLLDGIDTLAIAAADEMHWDKKRGATWKDLQDMYLDAEKNDPDFLPSRELEKIVMRLNYKHIEDMDIDAIGRLIRAAVQLRTEYQNRKKAIGAMRGEEFKAIGKAVKQELEEASKGRKRPKKWWDLEQLNPIHFLEMLSGWKENSTWFQMMRQLEEGERNQKKYIVEAMREINAWLTSKENRDFVARADGRGRNAIWYEAELLEKSTLDDDGKPIKGDMVKVYYTPMQLIHLYLESKNYQNLQHMDGGRTFADKKLYSKGRWEEAFREGATVVMTPSTVKALVANMTEQELELAGLIEKYYNGYARTEINRVSNVLYGYDRAISKNYAPIKTNQNYNESKPGLYDIKAENAGSLKERQQVSKTPSYQISAIDALNQHIAEAAKFVGIAIPVRDVETMLNLRVGGRVHQDAAGGLAEPKATGKEHHRPAGGKEPEQLRVGGIRGKPGHCVQADGILPGGHCDSGHGHDPVCKADHAR